MRSIILPIKMGLSPVEEINNKTALSYKVTLLNMLSQKAGG